MEKLDTLFPRLDHDNGLCDNKNVVLLKLEYLVVCIIKKLVIKRKKHSLLINIYKRKRASQQEKPVAHIARKLC